MLSYDTIMEMIDMRSFANLWYWIVLAVVWSSASYFILGVPFDMYRQARWHGGQAEEDLITLIKIYIRRIDYIMRKSGLVIIGLTFFVISLLAGLGLGYGNEFSQALLLLFVPLSLIAALNVRNCYRVKRQHLYNEPEKLYRLMFRYRLTVQIVGVIDVAVTTFCRIAVHFMHAALVG